MPVPQLLGEFSLKGQGAEFLPVGFVVDPDEEGEVKKEVGTHLKQGDEVMLNQRLAFFFREDVRRRRLGVSPDHAPD
ncbi:hypothetical protein MRBLRH13_003775 [Agrobacterium radiobacter]|uniref:hypothetical protein n=1 Tax=Agrobacterium radiobacter TaxID=362 RepID=UPI003415A49F